mgnify:CR=1 FL=1
MVGYLECPLFQALYIPNINTYRMHRIRGVMQTLAEKSVLSIVKVLKLL